MRSAVASLILALLVSGAGTVRAAQQQGRPPGSRAALGALDRVATIDLQAPELDQVLKEDLEREQRGLPPRFAVSVERHLTPHDAGTWEDLEPGTLLWRLRIRARGVQSLNMGFAHFRMTAGARLDLYSADLVHVVRPFTAADNEAHGELWTPVVLTDDLVVQLTVPAAELDGLVLELASIGLGYRGFAPNPLALSSGSCNVDVACPEGLPWALEIPAVGVISTGGSTFCTGFLVNDLRQDVKPYFMTAAHCGIDSGSAASLVVYWNYQNSTCRPPGSPASGGNGDGSLAQFNTGSIFRAASGASDFTLVELDDPVDPAFDASYAGWNATGTTGSSAVCIHHPNTSEKRISFEYDPPTTTSFLTNPVPGDGTHVRIVDWDLGTTEAGSSGSPLFDPDHRVIGQLHGGYASCTNQSSDWYGKLSISWNGGGTSSTRLSSWLDPDGTGVLLCDTVSLDMLCSDAGTVAFDRSRYPCSGDARVSVLDCGPNTNSAVAETVTVNVSSSSEPLGESLVLTETGVSTSRFEGSLALAGVDSPGVLLVNEGDALTARYVDADDGQGGAPIERTDTALIDCTPPNVLAVTFSNVTATSARITVLADEPILAEALYGSTCALASGYAAGEALATSATVELTGLAPSTTYRVKILASDEATNTTLDDAGGACHALTTAEVPRFFTEQFQGDRDLTGVVLAFQPAAGQDGYTLCTRAAAGFYTDPSGGSALGLTDDGSALVGVSGGSVPLYGNAYTSFHVNANGNLTFGAADDTVFESLAQHFALPRVAAWFDDLNPAAAGSVTVKELADRVAVTWQDVPEYGLANQNSFQVELFFDGRIRLTYLALASADGIAGLSRGTGQDPLFVESDLSAFPPCAFVPPARGSAGPTGSVTVGR